MNKKTQSNQSSYSNFSDIVDNINNKLIDLIENLNNSSFENKLLKTIFNKKVNFSSLSINDQLETCNKIYSIITEILNNNKNLMKKIITLNNIVDIFLTYSVTENPINGTPYIIEISSGSLTLSKDYYFNEIYKNELNGLKEYRYDVLSYLKNTYNVFSNLDIDTINKDVEFIETKIAPYILSNELAEDAIQRTNKYKLTDLITKFPNINFDNEYFLHNYNIKNRLNTEIIFDCNISKCKNIENNTKNQFDLDNGDYYWSFIDDLFFKYRNDTSYYHKINNYMIWKTINAYVPYICEDLRLKQFYFNSKYFSGQKNEKSIKIRAIKYLINTLPELIGNIYCEKYFTNDHKTLVNELINYLLIASKNSFKHKCDWMDAKSINCAIKKINKLYDNKKIGYPNKDTYNYKYMILKRIIESLYNDKYDNMSLFDFKNIMIHLNDFLNRKKLNKKNINNTEWSMSSVETNAYFNPLKNEIVFPAGILQEPFFFYFNNNQMYEGIPVTKLLKDRKRLSIEYPNLKTLDMVTMASNFGSIGAIIGHEISHSFDNNGSKYDDNGKLNEWWSESVKKNYNNITDKLVTQYNKYFVKIHNQKYFINGKLTLGENIADLFGLNIAIIAYKIFYVNNKQKKTLNQGLIELFVSFANTWRYVQTNEEIKTRMMDDVHTLPKFRVNGTIKNIEDFYLVFKQELNSSDIIQVFKKLEI